MTITEVLVAEHTVFLSVFDQVERALQQVTTAEGVRMLAGIVHGLLEKHAENEANLAYVALDHALAERGRLDQLHQDHREIDDTLRAACAAENLDAGRQSLRAALHISRKHFCFEEVLVFPMIEEILQPETLAVLGRSLPARVPALQA
jgi:hypothetical protein